MGLQSFKEIQTIFEFIEKEAQKLNLQNTLLGKKSWSIFWGVYRKIPKKQKHQKWGGKPTSSSSIIQDLWKTLPRGPRNGPRYTVVPTISRHRASHCNSLGRSDQRCLRKKQKMISWKKVKSQTPVESPRYCHIRKHHSKKTQYKWKILQVMRNFRHFVPWK